MNDPTTQASDNPRLTIDRPESVRQFQLRLWPGVGLAIVLWVARVWGSIGEFAFYKFLISMLIAPLVVLVGLLIWWLFASRLRWFDRILVASTFAVVTLCTALCADASFRGMGLVVYALPIVATAWPGWLVLSFWLPWAFRRGGVLAILVATGVVCSLLRIDGMDGNFAAKFCWRWTPTPEERLLAELKSQPAQAPGVLAPAVELSEKPGDWTGFRGPRRDSRLSGVRIKTDWRQTPPEEIWRHRIGPGWSSFAAVGDRLFTQEQRGEDEYVVCYEATKGAELWAHHDPTRFSELVGGPGPRATPTFHMGRLYTFGANGRLNCLDAASGKPLWWHDVVAESGATVPQWGYASSPLVAEGLVVVFAGAPNGKTMVAYQEEKGEPAWTTSVGPPSEAASLSYCSAQLATVNDVEQILLATNAGLSGFVPVSGKELWHHPWPSDKVVRIVQPALIGAGDLLIGTGMGVGTRRIHVHRNATEWQTEEQWTTRKIKPYFNDFVVLNSHLYGFDGSKFLCISLKDGSEAWRASGYGNGQVILLADQDLLLIVSEEGDVALVSARPDKHEELGRFKAVEGKTWNHPVIAHGRLIVRNGEEVACFKLAMAEETGK